MIIAELQLRQLQIPLRFQFAQANNSGTKTSSAILIILKTADGIHGFGEACPRMYVTGEDLEQVGHDFKRLQPLVLGQRFTNLEEVSQFIARCRQADIGPSIVCAFELAYMDAWSKTTGQPLPDLLEINTIQDIRYSLVLPLIPLGKWSGLLDQLRQFQPPAIKIKVDQDWESALEKIRLTRACFGDKLSIRLDVNGGWNLEEAQAAIPHFLEIGVHSFEQPVAAADWAGLQQLTQTFGDVAQIMADESLLDIHQARMMLENKVVNHFNLKVAKLGGFSNTMQIYYLAQSFGVPCQLGAHFGETSILANAGWLVAQMAGQMTAYEGALGDLLLENDITTSSIRHNQEGRVNPEVFLTRLGFGEKEADRMDCYSQVMA